MRALAMAKRQDTTRKKKQKEKELKKIKNKINLNSMEWNRVLKLYKNPETQPIVFRNIHPELRIRFNAKCALEGATGMGKLRYFMWVIIKEKIDHEKMNSLMEHEVRLGDFSPISEKIPHVLVLDGIPKQLHREFKRWCVLRGFTISGKLKQLILAYMKGYVE